MMRPFKNLVDWKMKESKTGKSGDSQEETKLFIGGFKMIKDAGEEWPSYKDMIVIPR